MYNASDWEHSRSPFVRSAPKAGIEFSDNQTAIPKGFSLFIFRKSDILSSLSGTTIPANLKNGGIQIVT